MTRSDTTCTTPARTADSPCASARPAPVPGWLARATAAAVLCSGLNALVQMLRMLASAWGRGG